MWNWVGSYSPKCVMVQWGGMDARDCGYRVELGGISRTVPCV